MNGKKFERGQALILVVLAIVGLIGLTGLTIDGGSAYSDRRHAQNAADTASLSAALALTRDQDYEAAAMKLASANGYDNNGLSNEVTITTEATPADACPTTGSDITVTIVSHIPTTFARLLGRTQVTNTVSATARACDIAQLPPLYNGAAIYSTKKTSCNGSSSASLYVNGSGNLTIWGGDLGSGANDPDCLLFQGGTTLLKKKDDDCPDIITSASSGGTFNHITGEDGCGSVSYNQAFADPPTDLGITCSDTATKSGNTMSPGNYSGSFPPAGVTNLNPGTYCLNGDFQLNANQTLTGHGVTFVLNNGTLKWNGSSEVDLSPPESGIYKGLLIYAPPSNSYATTNNEINIDGGSAAKISGTILAQNLPCWFAGSGDIKKAKLQFVCYTWGINGNGSGEIMYDSTVLYRPIKMPSISLLR